MNNKNPPQVTSADSIQRKLEAPYFLYRTKDKLGSYFDRSHYRIVHFPGEAITEFFPPARLMQEDSCVFYYLQGINKETLDQMEYLPDTAIREFEAAARKFYGLDGFDSRVNETERRLRLHFKLPDPRLEPEAYWLYGPRENRKLLILWGTELKEGSSLPLCPVPGLYEAGDTIIDLLKRMRMSERDKQRETTVLLRARKHPLANHIASPVHEQGVLAALNVNGQMIPIKSVKPLRHLWKSEYNQFKEAVDAFYDGCSEADDSISSYEKDLRLSFRLPDPASSRRLYFRHKGRLLVVPDESKTTSDGLYLTERKELNIPPQQVDSNANPVPSDTLLEVLKPYLHPTKLYWLCGLASAAILTLAGVFTWLFWIDSTPPALQEVTCENDLERIAVRFSEPIDLNSIIVTTGQSVIETIPSFRVATASDGKQVEIHEVARDEGDPTGSIVILKVDPLEEGGHYRLIASSISDLSVKSNLIKPDSEIFFQPLDTIPPTKPLLSAHTRDTNKLILIFDEPLHEQTATRHGNYRFPNNDFRVTGVDLLEDQMTVEITTDRTDRSTEEPGFIDGGIYSLVVSGIADDSHSRNIHEESYEFLNFQYLDRVAPSLEIARPLNQFDIEVVYDEEISKESALATTNYTILTNSGTAPEFLGIDPSDDPRRYIVHSSGMFNGVEYAVEVRNLQDVSSMKNIAEKVVSKPFYYTGREDKAPPEIEKIRVLPALTELSIKWNEPIDTQKAADPANYRIVDEPDIVVITVIKKNPESTLFSLVLNTKLQRHPEYHLEVTGVTDRIGNATQNHRFPFRSSFVVLSRNIEIESIRATSSTEIRVRMNEEMLNFENRASDPSYFSVYPDIAEATPFLIRSIGINPADSKEIICVLDSSTPLQSGQHVFRVESGLRINRKPLDDQGSIEGRFQGP